MGDIGKGGTRNSNVMFDGFGDDSPRNSAISLGETAGNSVEGRVNFDEREVLISQETPCRIDWEIKPRGKSKTDERSRVIDTGLMGGVV